ncbi:accessory Sec system protein Asp1 [Enterococcus sp. AZ141]|uniref:accessory Sec system protein Asp1 n=1 Tax=Enterococcus TaxID=1350 RepID=UPI000B692689|nr:accessory Sec system protein Asp1 [Enterococcus sp. 3C7_DIV0644]MEC5337684.1 accessory Sec system protein Asp1 [Enterococcus casseliflavus]OTO25417.1 accessory Sec system protein Asp1 [Enterococcus sp. 3C7_DIV0644]OTO95852.1 accessory Sec system protein Asp1 [Enterococcus faecium]VTT38414.1 accessory Sec system protein Asp1 [Enterococcus casseliflavus]
MNYFIPDWTTSSGNLESDYMMNIIQLFKNNREPYHLLLLEHIPFLRYQMHAYELEVAQMTSLYDRLQDIQKTNGFPLDVDDLPLAQNVEKVYTPFGITLIKENQPFGEIRFNSFGFAEQMSIMTEPYRQILFFDDRGFISAKSFQNDKGEQVKKIYYNESGMEKCVEYFGENPQIELINPQRIGLKKSQYQSMDELLLEMMNQFQLNLEPEDQTICLTNERSLRLVKTNEERKRVIQIVSDAHRLSTCASDEKAALWAGENKIITDSTSNQTALFSLMKQSGVNDLSRIQRIPIYTTSFQLGNSNSIPQLVLYWNAGELNEDVRRIHHLLLQKVIQNDRYDLIIETTTFQSEVVLREAQKELVDTHFGVDSESEEYQKVLKYFEAKKAKKLFKTDEEAIEEIRESKNWRNLVEAVDVNFRIHFRLDSHLTTIRQDFNETRLYIDLSAEVDVQKQALAVSAGIPQLVRKKTDYVDDQKNGQIIGQIRELDAAIAFYLDDLNNWNQALVENISYIERFSEENIIKQWRELLEGVV